MKATANGKLLKPNIPVDVDLDDLEHLDKVERQVLQNGVSMDVWKRFLITRMMDALGQVKESYLERRKLMGVYVKHFRTIRFPVELSEEALFNWCWNNVPKKKVQHVLRRCLNEVAELGTSDLHLLVGVIEHTTD